MSKSFQSKIGRIAKRWAGEGKKKKLDQ